jgi:hypothetical protein
VRPLAVGGSAGAPVPVLTAVVADAARALGLSPSQYQHRAAIRSDCSPVVQPCPGDTSSGIPSCDPSIELPPACALPEWTYSPG